MKRAVWIAAVALLILHQDEWNWDSETLWLGMFPTGLAYHALYSIAAAALWFTAMRVAWPHQLEAWAEQETTER